MAELQLTLSGANFQTWFKGKTTILSVEGSLIEIGCSSPYNKVWLEGRYAGTLKTIVDRITGQSNTVVFTVSSKEFPPKFKPKEKTGSTAPLFEDDISPSIKEAIDAANVNRKFSFSNFIIGQTNQLAFAVAKAVVETPVDLYNPLLIHGGVGVGKTHLLQSIAQAAILRRPDYKVLYCSSETFTNDMVEAIQQRQTVGFRSKYRKLDLLIVDDIQFIAGRESTQEEFFHTFNHLVVGGKQVVLSCDRNPNELSNLQGRLKNRFVGGMVVLIEPPDLELREAILLGKAKAAGVVLDFSLVRFLAENLGSSIRDLEGALLRLLAVSNLTGKEISLEMIKSSIRFGSKEAKGPDKLLGLVAVFFSISVEKLTGTLRLKQYVFPRQVAMYLLRTNCNLSYKQVASFFGGRDHTTAMYSVSKVENLVKTGGEVASLVRDIQVKFSRG